MISNRLQARIRVRCMGRQSNRSSQSHGAGGGRRRGNGLVLIIIMNAYIALFQRFFFQSALQNFQSYICTHECAGLGWGRCPGSRVV